MFITNPKEQEVKNKIKIKGLFCNPYFVSKDKRQLTYDSQFNVTNKDLLLSLKTV